MNTKIPNGETKETKQVTIEELENRLNLLTIEDEDYNKAMKKVIEFYTIAGDQMMKMEHELNVIHSLIIGIIFKYTGIGKELPKEIVLSVKEIQEYLSSDMTVRIDVDVDKENNIVKGYKLSHIKKELNKEV